jgi:ABC-type sugar transport system permease subunit
MSASTTSVQGKASASGGFSSILSLLLRFGGLAFVDVVAIFLITRLIGDGVWEFAIFIALVTLMVNVINLRSDLQPLRWISPALALMSLMIIYPILYTVYVSFTNYGDGHLITKVQAINQTARELALLEGGASYDYVLYRNDAGEFGVLLTGSDGKSFFTTPNDDAKLDVEKDADGNFPDVIEGYTVIPRNERLRVLNSVTGVNFGTADEPFQLSGGKFRNLISRFSYDPVADAITDNTTGIVYTADDTLGFFVDKAGYATALEADPNANVNDYILKSQTYPRGVGYRVLVGVNNYLRFFNSPAISGPLLSIFIWTVTFALLSVLTTFSLGLLVALLLQADTPGKRIFRTLLIVPYAIPGLIAIATWRGMLNPLQGVLGTAFVDIFPALGLGDYRIFSDATQARTGILLINLWLGYPYFMLVCSGALAAIPRDMYEAAEVDGANAWQQFTGLTLPMLLVAVGPLLIASFTFNFNNFLLIEAFNEGGPPIQGTPTPAGQTDILISYAFRLAFGTGRGADFGLASAITIVIFFIVAMVTLFQNRFTRRWEETSENV